MLVLRVQYVMPKRNIDVGGRLQIQSPRDST